MALMPHARVAPVPVCDLHCDTVLELQAGASLAGHPSGHIDIPRLRAGGVGLQVFACFVPGGLAPGRALDEANALLDVLERACLQHADDMRLVTEAGEAERVVASGRIAAVAAIENGLAIGGDLGNLERFRARGVRYLTLTHARHLDWAASSGQEWSGEHGLSPLGEEVVREMNRLGIIVDVSHVHERTFWDVVRVSSRPFIASHSCAAALCPVGRNLTDDQLRAIAGAGGMVGVNFFPGVLDPGYLPSLGHSLPDMFRELEDVELRYIDDPPRKLEAIRALSAPALERLGPPRANLDTIVDHVEHMVRVMGDEHVGFGSDFDGVGQLPRDVPDCSAFPRILARLAGRGAGPGSLEKIAWDNFLRVLRANR
jgi:membrane dipeptidase